MAEICLNRNHIALVDDSDYEWLNEWKWHVNGKTDLYAAHSIMRGGGLILMHRLILGLQHGDHLLGDHINHNTLDNRRCNLRIASRAENRWNSLKSPLNTSGVKGVTLHKQSGKWQAQLKKNGRNIYLGLFVDPKSAHEAYQRAAMTHFGEFAHYGELEVA